MFQTAVALILFLLPLAYSPGPGNMFFAANGARFGFKATIPANVGYHIATWFITAAIGFGFATTMGQLPALFTILKIGGALYVFWIAWQLIKAGTLKGHEAARPATFWDGVILLILNPKAYVIIALMFTQFLGKSEAGFVAPVILIATVFTFNNFVAFSLWALVGDKIASYFRSPESAQKLNIIFGGLLIAVALWMLLP